MQKSTGILSAVLITLLFFCFTAALAEGTLSNIQNDGYIEQIFDQTTDCGSMELTNIWVSDWSELKRLPDSGETEYAVFTCLIAAQMIRPGMTWEEYFAYLESKGIVYTIEYHERFHADNTEEAACALYFMPDICLYLEGDPIASAAILMEGPFEVNVNSSVQIDLNNNISAYLVITDDGNVLDETELDTEDMP